MTTGNDIFETQDGSHSIFSQRYGVSYHSRYGALQESRHVFLEAGFIPLTLQHSSLRILEIGLGTGLNALLTALECEKRALTVYYEGWEVAPLPLAKAERLNYPEIVGNAGLFSAIHRAPWRAQTALSPFFSIFKMDQSVEMLDRAEAFDLVYYDAFAPNAQPGLWELPVLEKVYRALLPGGVLVTYCAKGAVKRNLRALGFELEALPGPPGKREMTRARKTE